MGSLVMGGRVGLGAGGLELAGFRVLVINR